MELIRTGYKRTEVGVIPEDWELLELREIVNFKTGPFGSMLHKADYVDDGVPVINPMQIIDGRIIPTKGMMIPEDVAKRLRDFRISSGQVIIGRRGELGRSAYIKDEQEGWLCGTGSMVLSPKKTVSIEFVQRQIMSPKVIRALTSGSVGTTMQSLNQASLGAIPIPLPPTKVEQNAIATALGDADALITGLETLIAKKRALKEGTMQERLKPNDTWAETTLGELGPFLKGKGVNRSQAKSGDLPCIRYGEIYTQHDDFVREFHSWISREVADTALLLKKGDILFAGSGETKAEIGKAVAFLYEEEAYAGGDIVVLRPHDVDSLFLGYYLNTPGINSQKASRGQGDAVVHIHASALASITLLLPSPKEQSAIAAILSDMDSEIATLETKLQKARAIKAGMMAELLTGNIRLI